MMALAAAFRPDETVSLGARLQRQWYFEALARAHCQQVGSEAISLETVKT
jgi:hypothetical protein